MDALLPQVAKAAADLSKLQLARVDDIMQLKAVVKQ